MYVLVINMLEIVLKNKIFFDDYKVRPGLSIFISFHFNFFIHGNPLRYTVLQGAMQIQNLIITKIFNPIYNNLSQKKRKGKRDES